MNRAGRPRTPSHLKIIAGTYRKDRAPANEPKPTLAIPPCPPHLDGEARKEWRRISKDLFSLGLLTKIDRAALAAYCQCWARWVEAEEKLKSTGMVVKAPSGYPILSPYLSIANRAMQQLQSLLVEFGLSPASRSRIHAQPAERDDDEAKKEKRFFG